MSKKCNQNDERNEVQVEVLRAFLSDSLPARPVGNLCEEIVVWIVAFPAFQMTDHATIATDEEKSVENQHEQKKSQGSEESEDQESQNYTRVELEKEFRPYLRHSLSLGTKVPRDLFSSHHSWQDGLTSAAWSKIACRTFSCGPMKRTRSLFGSGFVSIQASMVSWRVMCLFSR